MSEQPQPPLGPPPEETVIPPAGPQPAEPTPPSRMEAEVAMFKAIVLASTKSLTADDPREMQEWADSVLKLSQAIVILDPKLVAPQGAPPEVIARSMPSPPEPAPVDAKGART